MMTVSEMRDGSRVYGQLLVSDSKKGTTANGRQYLTVVLQDNSGSIEGKKWELEEDDEAVFAKGNIVFVDGEVVKFRDVLQMKIRSGQIVAQDGIDWSKFIANAPFPLEEMKKKLAAYIDALENEDVKTLVKAFVERFQNVFLTHPGAVRNHHDYVSGLLYHSLTMADLGLRVCEIYPSLNRDLVIGGAIIHDIGKTVELSGPQATTFTLEGKLLGHISIGQAELRRIAKELGMYAYDDLPKEEQTKDHPLYKKKEVAVMLEHIILSHHTRPEFGSPLPPLTREALAVAMIDDFDAKMMILDKAYLGIEKGATTAKIFTMDDRYFYNPVVSGALGTAGLSYEAVLEGLKKE